jgi:hypothetical protein
MPSTRDITVMLLSNIVVGGCMIFVYMIISGKIDASEGLKGQVMGYTQAARGVRSSRLKGYQNSHILAKPVFDIRSWRHERVKEFISSGIQG